MLKAFYEQWASRCSLGGVTSLMAASLKLVSVSTGSASTSDFGPDKSLYGFLPSALEAGDDGANEAAL